MVNNIVFKLILVRSYLAEIAALVLCLLGAVNAHAEELKVHVTSNKLPLADAVVSAYSSAVNVASAPIEPAIMDQRNLQYSPYVIAVQVGTSVAFPNSDDIRHHVYSFSPAKRFELRLYHGTTAEPVLFDEPGKVVLGCNIHDSMLGYIFVVDTPYFALTDAKGEASVNLGVANDWTVRVEHPRSKRAWEQQITASQLAGGLSVDLGTLTPDPRKAKPISELDALFK